MSEQKYKILIVDDDEFLLEMYSLKFRTAGYQVEVAKSGEEALEKIRGGLETDAMLLDVVMPGLDGFETMKIIRKEKLLPKAVFVFLTNLGQKEEVEKGMRLGADDYIIKAYFTPTEAMKKVEEALKKKNG
ncbi:MAG: Two component transcriptional regulator, winged helix family [Parcubacteria group bacterium GW2011_GWB1_41_6]|nr:MAG: Two component transcriptional regulator, winged helix family [Parcubacteria group bacterium GW2011_GWB1_41_6]KKS34136.1 MAG: Two component transcriptional regulator, winged helix family [Parcubacteria group bacterium GW2011_GWC2_42_13]KKS57766.1 MAG: Two component transcriptional regulator, winged helix family [Parcubacteria group bacterium GW2011_GWA2_42_35]KKS70503.1 MAG: Two component transcriptional regulator, winged helix family [Parcubacteria group bacterium GW2011_GWF2_42_7]